MSAIGNYEVINGTFDYPNWQVDVEIPAPTDKVILGCHVGNRSFYYYVKSDGSAMVVRANDQYHYGVRYWMTVAEMGGCDGST